jgi:hypothetical protein
VQGARAGNGDLRQGVAARSQKPEILHVNRALPLYAAADHRARLCGHPVRIFFSGRDRVGRDVTELGEKIAMIRAAAKLTVRDEAKSEILLKANGLLDRAIFQLPKFGVRKIAARVCRTEPQQVRRTQQAADMLGTKGRREGHILLAVD